MKRLRQAVAVGLLAFAGVSLGVVIGKQFVSATPAAAPADWPPAGNKTVLLYMHKTVRCVTCNQVESRARQAVATRLAGNVQAGSLEWRTVNFEEHPDLAAQFTVASSSLIIASMRDGKVQKFQSLDDVWQLLDKPKEFDDYLCRCVQAYLGAEVP